MSAFVYVALLAGLVAVHGQSTGPCSSSSVSNSGSAMIGSSVSPVFSSAGGSQISGFCSCPGKKDADYLRLFFTAQSAFVSGTPAFTVTCAKPKKLALCPASGKCYKVKKLSSVNIYSSCSGGACALYAEPVCASGKKGYIKVSKTKIACGATASSVSALAPVDAISCAGKGAGKKMIKASPSCTLQYSYFPPINNGNNTGNSTRSTGPAVNSTGPPANVTGSLPPLNGTTPAGGATTGPAGTGPTVAGTTGPAGTGPTVSGASGATVSGASGATTSGAAGSTAAATTTPAPTTTTTVAAGR